MINKNTQRRKADVELSPASAEIMTARQQRRGHTQSKPTVPGFAGQRLTPLRAIASFCRACLGGPTKDCMSMSCIFWPYRMGVIEVGASRSLVKIIRRYCSEQCLPGESPAGCSAGIAYHGLAPCPCWPYRNGKNPYIGPEQREKLRRHALRQLELTGSQGIFAPRTGGSPTA